MLLDKISSGRDVPNEINVIIEIPAGASGVKYEFDKDSGAIFVDRFVNVAMHYPANYGFIPHTLAEDGDPLDVLVITQTPLIPGSVLAARPIGLIYMEDESGKDEKIIALPTIKSDRFYKDVNELTDLPEIQIKQIKHFFERYKDLDDGKWVKISGTGNSHEAKKIISKFII